ncbi:Type-1 restriction enzyme MjaXIP specificity protein [uncultured archaeon]|nr:Type-1 restriction enzyme MjaXIP specificity protein [uncultured archaeon]
MNEQKIKFKESEIGEIPEEWDIVTVTDVSQNFDNKRKPISSNERLKMKGQYPYYGAAGIIDYIDDFNYDGNYLLIAEDGTVTSDGSKPMLQLPNGKFWVSNHAHVLKCQNYEDTLFLYYQLKNTNIIPFITGAVQPKLSQENLNKIKFGWPRKFEERKKFTKILSDFDSKIELNQRMNENIEKIGQSLFKQWFVNYEFPNEKGKPYSSSGGILIDSELGKIPKKWIVTKLRDFVDVIKGCSYSSIDLSKSDNALVTLKSITRGGGFNENGFKEYVGKFKPEQQIYEDEIVVAHTDLTQNAEVLGQPALIRSMGKYKALIASLDLVVVRPKEHYSKFYIYYLLKDTKFQEHAYSYANGSTVLHLSSKAIPEYLAIIPSNELLKSFYGIIEKFNERIKLNLHQTKNLEELRDSLLPKLMSGQIRVKSD